MSYTVIARRYRSQTFDDVVGQDAIARTLKNAIQMDRVAHAYLFSGTRGVGKTTMARILAKSLNCLNADGPTVTPCLECDSCVSVNVGEDIDVVEIDGASNNKVDNIRELISNAIYRPARARFKIYIIDEVHMLTASAFNALLKTLEEPPEHVKFIFATTEPNKVLATIQSRCQRFDFQNISVGTIGVQLEKILEIEKITYEKDMILLLSRMANGSMRDGLSLLDQLISSGSEPLTVDQLNELVGVPDRQKVMNLLSAIASHNAAEVVSAVDQLIAAGQSAVQICDLLVANMRDIMVFSSAGADSSVLILTADEKSQLTQLAGQFDIAALIYNITALEKLRWTLKNSETSRALLEASLLRLALSEHFIGLDRLSSQTAAGQPAVKKKLTVPGSSAPARSPAESPKTASLNIPATYSELAASWPAIVNQLAGCLDNGLSAFLNQGKPARFKNASILISFQNTGQGQLAKNMCERKIDLIQKGLSGLFARSIKVDFEIGQTPVQEAPAEENKPPVPVQMNQRQRNEALNDPVVQKVLQGLNAKPIEISRIETEIEDIDSTAEEEVES